MSREENVEKIGKIDMVHKLKYLGIIVNDKQARKMANMTYSVMHKSCNKIMIDKVYWKSVVLPSVLMGASMICWMKSELEVLQ